MCEKFDLSNDIKAIEVKTIHEITDQYPTNIQLG